MVLVDNGEFDPRHRGDTHRHRLNSGPAAFVARDYMVIICARAALHAGYDVIRTHTH